MTGLGGWVQAGLSFLNGDGNMKQGKIVRAYTELDKIKTRTDLPKETKLKLFEVRRKLRPFIDFQNEEQDALEKKYAKLPSNEEHYAAYLKELEEISNLEQLFECEEVEVPMWDDVQIGMMEALDGFVKFV